MNVTYNDKDIKVGGISIYDTGVELRRTIEWGYKLHAEVLHVRYITVKSYVVP